MNTAADTKDNKSNTLFTSARDLVTRELSVDYLVEDLIEKGTSGLIFGPSGEGKTFVVLDMGLSIATAKPWAGKKTEKGLVIYFCGEGHSRIPHRIIAWQKEHGLSEKDIELFHSSETTLELENIEAIIKEIKDISEYFAIPVSLIIIDTLAQHLLDDCDENSTKDMKKFLKIIAKIRDAQIKCTSLIVHHPGYKDQNRARGASSLKGTLDFEISCNKKLLEFTKMKDGLMPDPMAIDLKVVEIGTDKISKKVITSTVVMYGKAKPKKNNSCKLNSIDYAGVNSLVYSIINSGCRESMAADYEICRRRFYEVRKEEEPVINQPTLNKQFNRMIISLEKKEIIRVEDSSVILLNLDFLRKVEEGLVDSRRNGT